MNRSQRQVLCNSFATFHGLNKDKDPPYKYIHFLKSSLGIGPKILNIYNIGLKNAYKRLIKNY